MKLTAKLFWLAIVVISLSFFFLRFNRYTQTFNFAMDQGVHLIESKAMIDNKHPALIGPSSSKTYQNRQFFTGPIYYYILAVLGAAANWNPLIINAVLIVIDFIFIIWFVFWLKHKYGEVISITVFLIFAFSKYFIFHHTFFWNPHFLVLLGISAIIFLDKYIVTNQKKWLYIFGYILGLAFSFHYTAIFWIIPVFLIVFKKIKTLTVKNYLITALMFFIGDLPFFLFEIRHNFYNVRTAFLAFIHPQETGLTSHYFVFPLIIFLIYLSARLLHKSKKKTIYSLFILIIFFVINHQYKLNDPTFKYSTQIDAVSYILKDGCPQNFNIAQTQTGDSRAYNLRFLLSRLKCQPNSVNEYPNSQLIYLISNKDRPFESETVWEVTSGTKLMVVDKTSLDQNTNIYKLGR